MNKKMSKYISIFVFVLVFSMTLMGGVEKVSAEQEDQSIGILTTSVSESQQDSDFQTNSVSENKQDGGSGIKTNSVSEETQDGGSGIKTNSVSEETQDGGSGIKTNSVSEETQDGAGNGQPSNGGGSRTSGSGGGSRAVTQISNIKVTPVGSSASTTTLVRGNSYTVNFESPNSNGKTTVDLVNTTSGVSILIGTKDNVNGINSLNWTVPNSSAVGNYMLRFTDSGNNSTVAVDLYRIATATTATGTTPGASPRTGSGSSNLGTGESDRSNGSNSSDDSIEETPLITTTDENDNRNDDESQTASVIGGIGGFLGRNIPWFILILIIIGGILGYRQHLNKKN